MSERRAAERRGRSAEFLCAWALRCKGYRVLDRRARGPLGEIDIVARRREVKARREASAALEATTARQRGRIALAAELYLARHPALVALPVRFDLMVVIPWRLPIHIRGAWRPPV
jgi:putative endonuclease